MTHRRCLLGAAAYLAIGVFLSSPRIHAQTATGATTSTPLILKDLPDTPLVDQEGRKVRFRTDVVGDELIALNFVFTSCKAICPMLGATFAGLQRELARRGQSDVRLVSISIDPATDTPERLKAWASKFGAGARWTLLTGDKPEVDALLKRLGVFTAVKEQHAPLLLLGNPITGQWTRTSGVASSPQLADLLDGLRGQAKAAPAASPLNAPARDYFGDTLLVDQHGREHRFYSDLMQGKSVVIAVFFSRCPSSCPRINSAMARIQEKLGDRVGRDVHLLSITVEPQHDTPEKLAAYAERFRARRGWYFLTGKEEAVTQVLQKLGQAVARPEDHNSVMLVGNDRTGLWKKAFSLAPAAEVLTVVESVVDDSK